MTARVPLIACVAVLAFFAGITGVRLAYTLAYVLVLLLAVAYVWSRLLARKLRVTRESPQGSFMMGEPFQETFTVKNESGLRLPYCEVRDGTKLPGYAPGRAFALAAGGTVTWTARGMFNLRGVHHFGPLEARLGDPFGLFPRRIRVAPENEVVVYPAIHALLHSVPQWSGNGVAEAHRGQPVDVPPDVSTIRDYAPTDGLSRIHWASTARTGRLISRTFDTRLQYDGVRLGNVLSPGEFSNYVPDTSATPTAKMPIGLIAKPPVSAVSAKPNAARAARFRSRA